MRRSRIAGYDRSERESAAQEGELVAQNCIGRATAGVYVEVICRVVTNDSTRRDGVTQRCLRWHGAIIIADLRQNQTPHSGS